MKKRLFIGVEIPNFIKKEIKTFVDENIEMPIFWKNIENMHLTVLFLGNISNLQLPQIINSIEDICLKHPDFYIKLIGIDQFVKLKKRTVFINVKFPKKLILLHNSLKQLFENKIDLRKNNFRPHVSLGRVKKGENINSVFSLFKNHEFGKFKIEKISLFESRIKNGQANYNIIQRFFLK
jgi:2'-5' RNA ligase